MKHLTACIACLLFISITHGQQITSAATSDLPGLVQQTLDSDCFEISNVTTTINGSGQGINSYGSFTASGAAFPFASGFAISTGSIIDAGNGGITGDLSVGAGAGWGGDADLEAQLGVTGTINATAIEFDFVSATEDIAFNYLLASEEYQLNFPCNVADGFVILLRPVGTTAYQNISVVPGTTLPVGVNTIHPEIVGECAAENDQFYAGSNLGATNYEGRTLPLTASATVIPNQAYHVKMVIADQFDFRYDSTVFVEAGSLIPVIDLGPDTTVCADITLDGDVGNPLATYEWLLNGATITGATSSTYTATQSGTYTVIATVGLNANTCTITDDVQITVAPNQLPVNAQDLTLCDTDGSPATENFDLSAAAADVAAANPAAPYDIDFFATQADADANVNALPGTYTNTSNPQTIFVRLTDNAAGCFGTTPIQLLVNDLPVAMDAMAEVCDEDGNMLEFVDLTQFEPQLADPALGYFFEYYNSVADAQSQTNPIGSNANLTQAGLNLGVRVIDGATGCVSIVTLNLSLADVPVLAEDTTFIDACEQDMDGFETFDLTSVEAEFTMGLTGFTVTYHETQMDAEDGTNPIANPTAYDNTQPFTQFVYIRVEGPNGCPAVGLIRLFTNLLENALNYQDPELCDDISNDGTEDFFFTQITTDVIAGIDTLYDITITIEYYTSQADQAAGINAIDPNLPFPNTSNPQEIFLTVSYSGCTFLTDFELVVNPYFEMDPVPDQTYCDEDQDLMTTIQLNEFDAAVRGSYGTDHSVQYFADNAGNPDLAAGAITTLDNGTVNPITVWGALTNPDGCTDYDDFEITVIPAPVTATPSDIIICDTDQDAIAVVDLRFRESEITTDPNRTFTYHLTAQNAQSGSNPIGTPDAYQTADATIYVRVTNDLTGCESVEPLVVIVNSFPNIPVGIEYQICETDGNGVEAFDLTTLDAQVINGLPGKIASYYTTQADAQADVNPIPFPTSYLNTSDPQTIYVRVQNVTDPSCFDTAPVTLLVGDAPTYTAPADIEVCDDDNDGITTIDLSQTTTTIVQGQSNLTVAYFLTQADADAEVNALPTNFTNTANPQSIFARVGNDQDCFEVEEFVLRVINSPQLTSVPGLEDCGDDYSGQQTFDLTTQEIPIAGPRNFVFNYSWHTDLADADAGTSPIIDPANYTTSTAVETVYFRVFNTLTGCYSIEPLDLIVNLPPDFDRIPEYEFCEEASMQLDLLELEAQLDTGVDPVEFEYYSSLTDANAQMNALGATYTYNGINDVIYVRAENPVTGCFFIHPVDLIVRKAPIIALDFSFQIRECDDDRDGVISFDLTSQNNNVLAGLDPATVTIAYYTSQADADSETNPVTILDIATGDEFYAVVTDATLGCTSQVIFDSIVDPLPIIPINEFEYLCEGEFATISADTGAPGETYLWSTGSTSSFINVTVEGNYSVVVTSQAGCSSEQFFTVLQSGSATIISTQATQFERPDRIEIEVTGLGDYWFQLDDGPLQDSNVFEEVGAGYHTITVYDRNGCDPVSTEVLVLNYPQFFTPNGDSFNDFWNIDDLDVFDATELFIFDRHGKLLKQLDPNFVGWDGTYNGQPLPSTDYWFQLNVRDASGDFQVRGHFTLKR